MIIISWSIRWTLEWWGILCVPSLLESASDAINSLSARLVEFGFPTWAVILLWIGNSGKSHFLPNYWRHAEKSHSVLFLGVQPHSFYDVILLSDCGRTDSNNQYLCISILFALERRLSDITACEKTKTFSKAFWHHRRTEWLASSVRWPSNFTDQYWWNCWTEVTQEAKRAKGFQSNK